MNIIEQAARRLEELRRSGVEAPASTGIRPVGGSAVAAATHPSSPTHSEIVHDSVMGHLSTGDVPDEAAPAVTIDLLRLEEMGYITPDNPRTQLANEFRLIKRPLLSNAQNRLAKPVDRANLIMVTSSVPGEGKTFVSINLAISTAMERDSTVLLVDADVARPSVLSRLGLPPSPGLMDVLTGSSHRIGDLLLRTSIERLSILPAGTPNGHATELLASVQMTRLLEELASRYPDRILVFDAPPLLPSTESRVLASHMGQVVVVVESERTTHQQVTSALSTIESCPVVFPLLNKTSRRETGGYYGYYGSEPNRA